MTVVFRDACLDCGRYGVSVEADGRRSECEFCGEEVVEFDGEPADDKAESGEVLLEGAPDA